MWIYQEREVKEVPEGAYGFIYLIVFTDGSKYIGRKNFYSTRRVAPLASGKVREGARRGYTHYKGTRKYYDEITKESNWKEYQGSSTEAKLRIPEEKHILEYTYTERETTYLEVKYLFTYEVLESEGFLNKNILGRFYPEVRKR